ncbi:unconventional myosin-Ig-like isoform X2 [Corticium candelabrum]|uniref:unconventional myosin-Ig-like isoform X2 n=1 Tax=Corticium candelabrum TaxID=121492 RepID=UPI002E2655CC|nr:unconventional myosin-Ig-like isoform X2 [Corticium candelabrum]
MLKIKHYAGNVTYSVDGFIVKNKDLLFQDLKRLLYNCDLPVLKEMFSDGAGPVDDVTQRPHTAGTGFKMSMVSLVEILKSKEPHYVRCVKPNAEKKSGIYDQQLCTHQVRYLGLLENVRVRRAGFAHRQSYESFVTRYKMLCKETWPRPKVSDRVAAQKICEFMQLSQLVKFGETKIFIKIPNTLFFLEREREKKIPLMATIIQKVWKGLKARRYYRRLRSALKIQNTFKSYKWRRYMLKVIDTFKDVKILPDLGYRLQWPEPPPVLKAGQAYMQKIHRNWRAKVIVEKLSKQQVDEMRVRCIAFSACRGRKSDWGSTVPFPLNGLKDETNPGSAKFNQSVAALKSLNGDQTVIYSAHVVKLGRNMKTADRAFVLTDKHLYRLDGVTYQTGKKAPIVLKQIGSVSLLPGNDQGMIIHTKEEFGDLVLYVCDGRAASEFVSIIWLTIKRKFNHRLKVTIQPELSYKQDGKTKTLILQQSAAGSSPAFKKLSADRAALVWPASS